jgi:hypothetical protein
MPKKTTAAPRARTTKTRTHPRDVDGMADLTSDRWGHDRLGNPAFRKAVESHVDAQRNRPFEPMTESMIRERARAYERNAAGWYADGVVLAQERQFRAASRVFGLAKYEAEKAREQYDYANDDVSVRRVSEMARGYADLAAKAEQRSRANATRAARKK